MEDKEKEVTQKGIVKEFGEDGVSFYTNNFEIMEHLYDKKDNVIHHKDTNSEWWREYDAVGHDVHYKNSEGKEWWREYDESGNEVHYKNNQGHEMWREYDAAGNEVHRNDSSGMEWWKEYDEGGKIVYYKDSNGLEGRYDGEKNKIHFKEGVEKEWNEYDT